MESRKIILMKLFSGKEWRPKCREWTCGHSGEGQVGMSGERSTSRQKLLGVRWRAGEKLLCAAGSPVLRSVMTWRDGMEVRGREARQGGDLSITMAVLHCCVAETNTTLQKKKKKFFKFKFKKNRKK